MGVAHSDVWKDASLEEAAGRRDQSLGDRRQQQHIHFFVCFRAPFHGLAPGCHAAGGTDSEGQLLDATEPALAGAGAADLGRVSAAVLADIGAWAAVGASLAIVSCHRHTPVLVFPEMLKQGLHTGNSMRPASHVATDSLHHPC